MTMQAKYPGTCSRCGQRFETGTAIDWQRGKGAMHATVKACEEAKILSELHAEERATSIAAAKARAPHYDASAIVEFIGRAKAKGLKRPAARFLGPANWELRLSLADAKSRNPGSVYVVLADQFIGMIRPDGEVRGEVAGRQDVLDIIAAVAKDPVTAAKAYGALMCRCSFCNLPLTDAGSVEVGYGPICASNYDLPHEPRGTPTLHTVPLS
jgi:hypothetical protein